LSDGNSLDASDDCNSDAVGVALYKRFLQLLMPQLMVLSNAAAHAAAVSAAHAASSDKP
jgi:hypothetical protein